MSYFNKSLNSSSFQNMPVEISFLSSITYKDPFNEQQFDVLFTDPAGKELKVPGFWAGGPKWKVRYSSPLTGRHEFVTEFSDENNTNLNSIKGTVEIKEYKGNNNLYKHGKLKIGPDNRHLEYQDGTPFFWLGDTWWKALTARCKWPEVFKTVTKNRVDKGFNVVQIAVGLGPEVPYPGFGQDFEKFENNEGGYCWYKNFTSINPLYFDFADVKMKHLVENEIVPCIFGPWGYYLQLLGIEKIKKHWRYLISRWGSYPVIWCAAGEIRMPYYDFLDGDPVKKEEIKADLTKGWSEIIRLIKEKDPFKNLLTAHPSPGDESYATSDIFNDPGLFDIDMLQTGHSDFNSFERTFKTLNKALKNMPEKPVIDGEPCYENIMGGSLHNTQRFLFWTHMLSGTAGHSYGTDGIWTFRSKENYMGKVGRWSTSTWKDGMNLPGSYQIGLGKRFLEKYEWQKFKIRPDWVIPHSDETNFTLPYCAGVEKKVRIIYIPAVYLQKSILDFKDIKVISIEKDTEYIAFFFDPRKGNIAEKQKVEPDKAGQWSPKKYGFFSWPSMEDWVLVLENINFNI